MQLLTLILVSLPVLAVTAVWWLKKKRDSKHRICQVDRNLDGKVALITGASSGLGMETALELMQRGATIVLTCRDELKAKKAQNYILSHAAENVDPKNLTYLNLDLSSISSVERFAKDFSGKYSKIDILINNAGVMGAPYTLSKDGVEMHFGVNHLGHWHLTNLLIPKLKAGAPSRIINVSSGYYLKMKEAVFENLRSLTQPADYNPRLAYARSKLANNLHALELAKRLKDTGISVYAMHPGFVRGTELGRHFSPAFLLFGLPFIWYFSKSLKLGIQTILYCCLQEDDKLNSGAYYGNCEQEDYNEVVTEKAAEELWDLSEKLVSEIQRSQINEDY